MTPQSQPATNPLKVERVRATTTNNGARLIHAKNHNLKSGNARTFSRADPATSDASAGEGIASRSARASEDRDDERITALFVMPRVYQQPKAVDSLMLMLSGIVVIKILEARKIFSGTVMGTRSVTLFESRITKSVTVKVTKIVFLTVALLTVS
jgi:hypothetical protein